MLELATHEKKPGFIDLLQVRPHHLRSVQIERDFRDPNSTLHYVVTPFVSQTISRLAQGFSQKSTARAWRLTGDYGSGKSSLVLALSRLAAAEPDLLPDELRDMASRVRIEPVLVIGEREPIGKSVLRGLKASLVQSLGEVPADLMQWFEPNDQPEPAAVLAALEAVAARLKRGGRANGLILVLDELGKNLEYAISQTASNDVYLLQHLAEAAARSGESPLIVVAVLHQAVASYASSLSTLHRQEWEKVAGRYEEVVFAPPIEQTANLVAAALDVDQPALPRSLVTQATTTMEAALELGWYGTSAGRSGLIRLAPALLPLDPIVLPVLSRILRRFGQNERSLFSFLSSAEPFGLMAYCAQPTSGFVPYRMHNLYDYISANLSGLMASGTFSSKWSMIDEIVRGKEGAEEIEVNLVKSIAVLNLLDEPQLAATPEILLLSVSGHDPVRRKKSKAALARLKSGSRLVYDRGVSGALCLWPHTSVDLEAAFDRANEHVKTSGSGFDAILSLLPPEPLVARRHYVETGALRHFDVHYVPAPQVAAALAPESKFLTSDADGRLLIFLSQNEQQRGALLEEIDASAARLPNTTIVGVPAPIGAVMPLLKDVAAWRWVSANVPELSGDRLARTEVARQLALCEARLSRMLEALLDIRGYATQEMVWFNGGSRVNIVSGRALVTRLSDICDTAFAFAPHIKNELINRRSLSSAAARARFLVIEGLAGAVDQPSMGLDNGGTPPELAIYLSVIKAGNVHVERGGRYFVQVPDIDEDKLRLRPALLHIGKVLQSSGDRPVAYYDIVKELRGGKFGIRDGLIPLLIAIYIAANWHRTAVYEDGTYLDQVGGPEFNRIVKEPEFFQLQYCAIEGVRAEVFARLSTAIGLPATADVPDLLDVVRPLVTFVARLPDHARRTRQLSASTVSARTALIGGVDPTSLIFRDLPKSFGFEAIEFGETLNESLVDGFVRATAGAIRELREAYPALLKRITRSLGAAVDCDSSIEVLRPELINRAERVKASLTEPELKAFVLRLADRGLEDQLWLESIASLVAKKPPERWADSDEADFHHRLPLLARRFKHVEATRFPEKQESGTTAYRLLVTSADGHETEQVYRASPGEENQLKSAEAELRELLARNGRIGRLAAARVLLELERDEKESE